MLKKLLQFVLARQARAVLATYRPEVIAITGSVGKTSTKEAIAAVIAKRFSVRQTYKNYNNEIGLPLTVLGRKSAGRSLSGWYTIFKQSKELVRGNEQYPKALVLEMGIDRPGDMDYLLSIARPTRAVITKLGQAHLEFFTTLKHLHSEKMKLAQAVTTSGFVVYNYDDENLREYVKDLPCQTIGFGFSEKADVRAEQVSFSHGLGEEAGISFKMELSGSTIPVFLPAALGRPPVYAALAAAAVGSTYTMNGLEIAEALRGVKQPAGRLHLIAGKNNSLIIDDTYNSSPDSVFEGLHAAVTIPKQSRQRLITILGDMRELGELSKKGHEDVAREAVKYADMIIAVGDNAKIIYEVARTGLTNTHWFKIAEEAAVFLEQDVRERDLYFIKGSQAVRLEKIVKRLMAYPEQAEELLVRQGREWRDR